MRKLTWTRLSLAITAGTLPLAAIGQDAQPTMAERPVAEQCLTDLRTFSQRLNDEQWWITGWGGVGGWGWGTRRSIPPGTGAQPGGSDPVAPGAAANVGMASPWGVTLSGVESPRNEIRILYLAANVLANQGKQEGCDYVLAELQGTYENYTRQLTEAGVDPRQITDWRQERIALASPVEDLETTQGVTVDDLTGTDVRSRDDESLGSVADIVFDGRDGDIQYVIVARGGFLGIGEDHVPVPWEQFRVAPGLNTLVLDISAAEMEAAPALSENGDFDPDADPRGSHVVDEFWSGQPRSG